MLYPLSYEGGTWHVSASFHLHFTSSGHEARR